MLDTFKNIKHKAYKSLKTNCCEVQPARLFRETWRGPKNKESGSTGDESNNPELMFCS